MKLIKSGSMFVKRNGGKVLLVAALFVAGSAQAVAPTDIAGVTTAVSGYADDAIVVGITVVLFVIGRKVVRKLI